MDTSHINKVKPPQHLKTPRSHVCLAQVSKAGKDGVERNRSRRELGGASRSDVAALRNAAAGFASSGTQKSQYCRKHSLGYATLRMVESAAAQLEREVPKSGVNNAL